MDYTIQAPQKDELTKKGFTNRIKICDAVTAEQLMNYGFTNYHKPYLYFMKMLTDNISFNLTINKKTLTITNIDVLDEDFLQPYDYQVFLMKNPKNKLARKIFNKVDEIFTKLQQDGIVNGYVRGMYI